MLFEMAAGQQIPANLHAALTYFIGELALRRIFLHRVLNYEDDLFSLLMVLVETHSLPTIETLRFRRRDVKIKANKDDRIQHLMRQTLVSVVFFGKLWHLHG